MRSRSTCRQVQLSRGAIESKTSGFHRDAPTRDQISSCFCRCRSSSGRCAFLKCLSASPVSACQRPGSGRGRISGIKKRANRSRINGRRIRCPARSNEKSIIVSRTAYTRLVVVCRICVSLRRVASSRQLLSFGCDCWRAAVI